MSVRTFNLTLNNILLKFCMQYKLPLKSQTMSLIDVLEFMRGIPVAVSIRRRHERELLDLLRKSGVWVLMN